MLVSVLIPAYNAEKWIADTIQSAKNQSWANTEVIVVDDGSRDNTLSIARQFECSNVKILTQENSGASKTRNQALKYAQGDYIQWLDADDILAPDKIELQMQQVEKDNDDLILYGAKVGQFFYRTKKAVFTPIPLWQDLSSINWIMERFRGPMNVWLQPGAWLLSRKLSDLTGKWDERLSLDDDGEYSCRLVSNSSKIKFVPEAILYYRTGNSKSLGRNLSNKALDSYFLSMQLCINHLLDIENTTVTRSACIEFISKRIYLFIYRADIVQKAEQLSYSLGGNLPLINSKYGWKYLILSRLFGKKLALLIKNYQWKIERDFKCCTDKMLYCFDKIIK